MAMLCLDCASLNSFGAAEVVGASVMPAASLRGAHGIVVKRPNRLCTAFLAGVILLGTHGAGGQTSGSPDVYVAQRALTPVSATDAVVHNGLFTVDVEVTDASGNPVSGLAPLDFTLLDKGHPAKIRTFQNALAASEPPPELIFVLDEINLSPQQLTETEGVLSRFLHQNGGHLALPCFLYLLTRDGLFSSLRSSTDGALLVSELERKRPRWAVWTTGPRELDPLDRWDAGLPRNRLSVRALGSIAIHQRDVPGRKVVVWIGPGWPVSGGNIAFDDATELSTRLREARITLDNVNVWLNVPLFDYHDYLEPPRSQKDMQPAKMALQVIATQTGGLVLDSSEDLDRNFERCAKEVRSFYTLTFNPAHTDQVDDYHDLRVEVSADVAGRALTVRAPTGYYNEPVYFDNPRPGIEKVTVAQLEELVRSRTDLLHKLENIELTERLNTPRLDALLSLVHGERERQALTTDADLSIALPPPPDDTANRPPPQLGEQRAILKRTLDYLQNALPRLPDFYALRTTDRFEEPVESDKGSWKMAHKDQALHFATGEHAVVRYRNGNEVVEKKKKFGKQRVVRGGRARDLESWGTFGPILAYVLSAATARSSTLRWERWERSKDGDLSVFSYKTSNSNIVPEITYCCLPEGNGTMLYRAKPDDNGEFAVNPETGAIMRIATDADLDEERDPDAPLIRSQIMVEYGPEELGGKNYICPQRSVEVSRGRSERQLHEWGMVFTVYSYFETMINDVTFGGYHKFGSEARILPGFEETEEPKTAAPPPKSL
jgi:VWFA-related protein